MNILVADDDPDDRLLIKESVEDAGPVKSVDFVCDGVELMDHVRRCLREPADGGLPDLILLDLNMPRKSGREAIAEIKADPQLRRTPVVVLTTSNAEEDVRRAYDMGANSYIVKPASYKNLVVTMKTLLVYWRDIARLPAKGAQS